MQAPWPRPSWASPCTTSSTTGSAGRLPADVWDDQIGVMTDVLDGEELAAAVAAMRQLGRSGGPGGDPPEGGDVEEAVLDEAVGVAPHPGRGGGHPEAVEHHGRLREFLRPPCSRW